ncbi:Gfo/Idh/MocA family oxidoreductase [Ruminococcus sp. OA3]|uniref:Gfo/Idh/MocA family protein n=1 Tax=Ruminococcus sp. OA3 TaxID=2914164 RepID=UPI001F051D9D|nr:Gfo/Idh/MocA family oxidoreductase [Ruminococcus sp. OA3]MCH1981468.1 Gfo/Idh/MocA family oxidoreductase [Ruminococcus sp. OA3]
MNSLNIAIIGYGNIAPLYIQNIRQYFHTLNIWGVFGRQHDKALKFARDFSIPHVYNTYDALLNDKHVDIVLNLTAPAAHYEYTRQALERRKHVYSEKPLALSHSQSLELLNLAVKKQVLLYCAPDTVLGEGAKSGARYIEEGIIGTVFGFRAHLAKRGVENWHPNPRFLFKDGGGPLMDMGPYYLSSLIKLFGPVHKAAGMSLTPMPAKTISRGPLQGQVISVETPTYITALLEFKSHILGMLLTSFDVHSSHSSHIEVYGTTGTLFLPDPDTFGGPVLLYRDGAPGIELPLLFKNNGNCRGLGISVMSENILSGSYSYENAKTAVHVMEVIDAIKNTQSEASLLKTNT